MANPWFNNDQNTLVDFTLATASGVEAKFSDVAAGFDALESDLGDTDQLVSDLSDRVDAQAIRVVAGVETPNLLVTQPAAARAERVLGFDESGDIETKALATIGSLLDTYTIVANGSAVLEANQLYYVTTGGYTLALPANPPTGTYIGLKFDGTMAANPVSFTTTDGVEGYGTLVVDLNFVELHLVFNGDTWKV
jgi:hypothetical protein